MKTKKMIAVAMIAMASLCGSLPAHAFDSVSLELGGGENTELARLGLQSRWESRWWQSNGTHIGGYWDLSLSQWRGKRHGDSGNLRQNVTVVGITPVLRFQKDSLKGFYAEAGIGANLLSELYNDGDRRVSTRFQFGDHIGIGYVFQNNLDIGLKIQHFSNAGIKKPNPGVDFAVLSLRYAF